MIKSDAYTMNTYYMGMVDEHNKVNFYDGKIRVVTPTGNEDSIFEPKDYLTHIGEHVEEWTYAKFPFLKQVGWKGQYDGVDSGVYRVGPLGRLNASNGMSTPLAQAEYEVMYKTLGGKPIHWYLGFPLGTSNRVALRCRKSCRTRQGSRDNKHKCSQQTGRTWRRRRSIEAGKRYSISPLCTDKDALVKDVNLIVATTIIILLSACPYATRQKG